MATYLMIVLTLFTVLGSAMLGWLARRYALGGRCGAFGTDALEASLPGSDGRAAGAIGTVAAGTAAVRYADDQPGGTETADPSSGSDGQSGRLSAIGGSATAAAAAVTAGVAGVAAKFKSGDSDADGSEKSSESGEQTGVLASISKGATAATAAVTAGAAGVAAKLKSGEPDADGSDKPSDSGEQTGVLASISKGATAATAAVTAGAAGVAAKLKSGEPDADGSDKSSESGEQTGVLASISKGATAATAAVTAGAAGVAAKLKPGDQDEASGSAKGASSEITDEMNDDEDDGVALVDVPATLSAEEAEAERLLASDAEIAAPSSRLDAPRSGTAPDDLTKIKGIGPKINGSLNERGIYYYDQIAGFSGSDLAWADRELGFKGRAVRDRWIPQAQGLMDGAALKDSGARAGSVTEDFDDDSGDVSLVDVPATLSAEEAEAERLLASDAEIAAPSSRLDAPRSGSAPDDLTKIKGIGPKINGSLNERGIYYYDQIAGFSGSDLAWADRELGFKGRAVRDRWIPQAQGLMDGAGAQSAGSSGNSNAVSPELEASHAEVRQLRKRLGLSPDSDGPANDPSKSNDARLEASQREARELRQQLWSKEEAEKAAAAKAEADKAEAAKAEADRAAAAQAQADKAAAKAEADKAAAERSSGGAGAVVGGAGIAAAATVDFGALSADEAEAERMIASGTAPKSASNRLDAPTPGFDPDDLTKIRGIGKPTRGRLNRNGIYYYDQIAGFTASDLAWADKEMNLEGRVVTDRWIPQAKLLAGETSDSSEGGSDAAGGADVASSPVVVSAPAPAGLLDKPIEGRAADDLTAIKGVGNVLQQQLNDKGIFYYSQIAEFSASDKEWADQSLGFPGRVERDDWIPQARELMDASADDGAGRAARLGALSDAGQQLDSLSDDAEMGEMSSDETEAMRLIESGTFVADESNRPAALLQSASEGAKDDLQQIKGVGPKLEDLLNSLGIYYHRQIGSFSATDIAWVDSKLRFKGRIVRDRWVDQAKRLS